MARPERTPYNQIERPGRIESGPGHEIALGFTSYNPFIINNWRIGSFLDAAAEKLPGELTKDEWHKWHRACISAAHMSGRPYNEYEGHGFLVSGEPTIIDEGVTKFPDDVQELIRLMGKDEFERLYNSPPPPELVNYMLSDEYLYGHKYTWPQLEDLTIEVIRGRLHWDPRFEEAGVPTIEEFTADPGIVVGQNFDKERLHNTRMKIINEDRRKRGDPEL